MRVYRCGCTLTMRTGSSSIQYSLYWRLAFWRLACLACVACVAGVELHGIRLGPARSLSRSPGVLPGVFLKSCSESSRDRQSRARSLLEVLLGDFSRSFVIALGVFLKLCSESFQSRRSLARSLLEVLLGVFLRPVGVLLGVLPTWCSESSAGSSRESPESCPESS